MVEVGWDIMLSMEESRDRDREKEMVEKLLTGDKRVLKRFYREYQPKLLGYVGIRVKSKEDAERRIASEKNYVNIKNRATMYGSALMRKLELQYGGQMLDGDWERMTLDKIVDLMDKGYRVEEIIPGLVL